jgi:hypothetical protein
MTPQPNFAQRIELYRPTKSALGWCCVLSVIGTMIVGFTWGGWVTGSTAADMASKAAEGANAKLAGAICAAQFNNGPNVAVDLAALTKLDTWQRGDFLKKGGWTSLPGAKEPVTGAADLCARQLTEAKL